MAEPKRISFTTVGSLKKDKKPKECPPTYRFNLVLLESNEKTCPEFNYNELQKSARGETSVESEDVDDPFNEDGEEDKLRAIAQKFEEKYGTKTGKKTKKKVGRIEDYIDLGMGYDENDPFIDNTDAYDELVPSTLTTQLGGYYINSGKLNFREVNSDSSDDEILDTAAKKRKRRMKELDKDLKRRKKFSKEVKEGNAVPKKRGRKPLDRSDGALMKSKKTKVPTVASLLIQHKAQQMQSAMANGTAVPSTPEGKTLKSSINEVIESVINASRDRDSNDGGLNATMGSSDSEIASALGTEQEEELKLPEGISDDLCEVIQQIKEAALKSAEGKCKFFSAEVNNMLLGIEMKSRELSCSQRSGLFAHLANHLPCTKETLLKRAKKLRLDQEDGKMKEPLTKLRDAINLVMPALMEKYAHDCLSIGERKEPADTDHRNDESDSDYNSGTEEKLSSSLPKKRFVWSTKIRDLLCDVVRIKMKCFEVSKTRGQSAEEYLRQFLEMEILPLWPKGWMRLKILLRESKMAHSYLTSKPKKYVQSAKKLNMTPISGESGIILPKSLFVANGLSPGISAAAATVLSSQGNNNSNNNGTINIITQTPIIQSPPSGLKADTSSAVSSTTATTTTITSGTTKAVTTTVVSMSSVAVTHHAAGLTSPATVMHHTSGLTSPVTVTHHTSGLTSPATVTHHTSGLTSPATVTHHASGLTSPATVASYTAGMGSPVKITSQSTGPSAKIIAHNSGLSQSASLVSSTAGLLMTVTTTSPSMVSSTAVQNAVKSITFPDSITVQAITSTSTLTTATVTTTVAPNVHSVISPPKVVHSSKSSVTYPFKSQDSITSASRKQTENPANSLIRVSSSISPANVSNLLKQVSTASAVSGTGSVAESTSGHKSFSLLDYGESIQSSSHGASSAKDVLSQVINACLADYPNSSSIKALGGNSNLGGGAGGGGGSYLGAEFNLVSSNTNKPTAVSSSAGTASFSHSKSSSSLHNHQDIKYNLQAKSLLKNPPPSANRNESHVNDFTYHKTPTHVKSSSNAARTGSLDLSTSQHHKAYSASENSPKVVTSAFKSNYEFQEAIERSLSKSNSGLQSQHIHSLSGSTHSYKKDPLEHSPVYVRKEPSDSQVVGISSMMYRKEAHSDQPLNFSTGRQTSNSSIVSGVSSSGTLVNSSQSCHATLSHNRVSPISSGYSATQKEGSKMVPSSSHTSGRVSNLPHPTHASHNSSSNNSARLSLPGFPPSRKSWRSSDTETADPHCLGNDVLSQAVASALFGTDSTFLSTSTRSAYGVNTSLPASASSPPQARPPSQPNIPSSSASTTPSATNHSQYGSGQSKPLSHYSTMDYSSPLPQIPTSNWRTSVAGSTPQSVYASHYAKMLPPPPTANPTTMTNYTGIKLPDPSKANSLIQRHNSSRNSELTAHSPPVSYGHSQGSSF